MSIEFQCGKCGSRLKAPDNSGGKRVKCPKCESIQTIPGSKLPPPMAEPPKGATLKHSSALASPKSSSVAKQQSASTPAKPVKTPQLPPLQSSSPLASLDNFLEEELTAGPSVKAEKPAWEIPTPPAEPSPPMRSYPSSNKRRSGSGAMGILKIPAIFMLLFSGLSILGIVINLGKLLMVMSNGDASMGGDKSSFLIGYGLGSLIYLIVDVVIIQGALCMLSGSNYDSAKKAAILASIPCCGLLSFPFGIWALIMLSMESVKRNFHG
jgi:hypothetical protein